MRRRDFLSAAGLLALFAAFPPAKPLAQARREVRIGNRRIRVVDIHGHFIATRVAPIIKGTPLEMNVTDTTTGPNVLGPERLQTLDGLGIDLQVLTHQGGWWYSADRDLAARIVQTQNEQLESWCKANPGRFVGFASVALQHPDLAATQLETAVTRMGMRGVGIVGSIPGAELATPKFDPFWAKVEALNVPVFVHPQSSPGIVQSNGLSGRGDLTNIIGNPLETTVFLSHMIFEGALDRFPRLRLWGAHGGGYLPSYLGRTEVTCAVRPLANCANKRRPSEYLRREIAVDSMVFTEEGLRHLVAEVGAGQVLFGTDIPFNWPIGIDLILSAASLSDADKEAILGGNALRAMRM